MAYPVDSSGLVSLTDLVLQSSRMAEMGRLIQDGNKIGAIKIYREVFDVGLKEAKDAVESLASGKSIQLPSRSAASVAEFDINGQSQRLAELAQLVQAGKKIEAIKRYREWYRVGLKDAKDAVDRLQAAGQLGIDLNPSSDFLELLLAGRQLGCLLFLAGLITLVGMVLLLYFRILG